ncbi:hypothetical protein [Ignatzschineria cameli]|nr:hypothetical protein [Ignatzschineria cameli]
MILKRVIGGAGTYHFILFTGACPLFGIDDANCRRGFFGRTR